MVGTILQLAYELWKGLQSKKENQANLDQILNAIRELTRAIRMSHLTSEEILCAIRDLAREIHASGLPHNVIQFPGPRPHTDDDAA